MKTEELILNENNIDWESLSADPNRSFTLAEIRMFRKRINWIEYLKCHNLSHDEMEIASKHFSVATYEFIALNNLADQDFLQEHLNDFLDWGLLIKSHYLSQETLMKMFTFPDEHRREWCESNAKGIVKSLEMNKLINLTDGSYDEFLVYANLKG